MVANCYRDMASYYDAYKSRDDYQTAALEILSIASSFNIAPRTAVDAACGTGLLTERLSDAEIEITGFDISEPMLQIAVGKRKPGLDFRLGDMRDPPPLQAVDMVTCWNDSINYLLSESDLDATIAGFRRILRGGGLLVMDLNTLRGYEALVRDQGPYQTRAGECRITPRFRFARSGEVHSFSISRIRPSGSAKVDITLHTQRHWPLISIRSHLDNNGFIDTRIYAIKRSGFELAESEDDSHKIVVAARSQP